MRYLAFVSVLFVGVFLSGCVSNMEIDKENNMCETDSDCEYFEITGGCYTPEYVQKGMEDCENGGPCPPPEIPREGVTCTCENNMCVTHG